MIQHVSEPSIEKYRFVFILTYGRSGSTILMRLMNSDPKFRISGENFAALTFLFQSINSVQSTKKRFGFDQKFQNPNSAWYGASDIDVENFVQTLIRSFVYDVLKPNQSTEVLGFKEIRYLPKHIADNDFDKFCEFLLERFPNSLLIFNQRPWWEVARSGWFRRWWPLRVRSMILQSDARFQRVAARHEKHCMIFQYRDLQRNPQKVRDLIKFVGADISDEEVNSVLSKRLLHVKSAYKRWYVFELIGFPFRKAIKGLGNLYRTEKKS